MAANYFLSQHKNDKKGANAKQMKKNQTMLIRDINKIKERQKERKNMNYFFDSSSDIFIYLDFSISLSLLHLISQLLLLF